MKIYLDAGHGGYQSGAVVESVKEKDLNLIFSLELYEFLRKEKHEIILSRTTDRAIDNRKRALESNEENCDLFISIHCNAHKSNAEGFEILHHRHSKKGFYIAKKISNYVENFTNKKVRDTVADKRKLTVLSRTKCPAVLIELGFMTNKNELDLLRNKRYRQLIIKGIVHGLKHIEL